MNYLFTLLFFAAAIFTQASAGSSREHQEAKKILQSDQGAEFLSFLKNHRVKSLFHGKQYILGNDTTPEIVVERLAKITHVDLLAALETWETLKIDITRAKNILQSDQGAVFLSFLKNYQPLALRNDTTPKNVIKRLFECPGEVLHAALKTWKTVEGEITGGLAGKDLHKKEAWIKMVTITATSKAIQEAKKILQSDKGAEFLLFLKNHQLLTKLKYSTRENVIEGLTKCPERVLHAALKTWETVEGEITGGLAGKDSHKREASIKMVTISATSEAIHEAKKILQSDKGAEFLSFLKGYPALRYSTRENVIEGLTECTEEFRCGALKLWRDLLDVRKDTERKKTEKKAEMRKKVTKK